MKLEAVNLTFSYPKSPRRVLDGVGLTLESGQRMGLLAPSGRGKTTLCRLLAGYEVPAAGQVLLDGRPLSTYGGPCPVQLVWQHPDQAVDPLMTLGDTLEEAGRLPREILTGLGIEEGWLTRRPGQLSGGELQRLCLARALGGETRFLLCDELTAMLDPVSQAKIWRFLLPHCARRDIGLLAVSHSKPLLERICGRVIVL